KSTTVSQHFYSLLLPFWIPMQLKHSSWLPYNAVHLGTPAFCFLCMGPQECKVEATVLPWGKTEKTHIECHSFSFSASSFSYSVAFE
ncbi:hypothetical protein STEG23_035699, partial [Scotinomys teguina]